MKKGPRQSMLSAPSMMLLSPTIALPSIFQKDVIGKALDDHVDISGLLKRKDIVGCNYTTSLFYLQSRLMEGKGKTVQVPACDDDSEDSSKKYSLLAIESSSGRALRSADFHKACTEREAHGGPG
jgi:hypothetical protein